jgi:hypothetical protein
MTRTYLCVLVKEATTLKPFKRMASRLGLVGAALALSTVGLLAIAAPPASGSVSTITETFGASGPTGPLELQTQESVDQPGSVTQGNAMTITVQGGTQVVPTTQSSVAVNFISGLTTIVPVPANSTLVPGSSVGGNWSFTDTSNNTTTGPIVVTECSGPGTGCTATTPNGTTFLGPGTSTPYIEESTGTAQFSAGGTLTLPNWSFQVTASGSGTIQTTVSEFDTSANITLFGNAVNAVITAYPAAVVAGCLNGGTCTQGAYQFQPIATTTILTPPAAPVLKPQTGNVSAGQCTTINVLSGATDTGTNDGPNPASVVVTTDGTAGHAVSNGNGTVTYCNTPGGTAATDTFQVTAADLLASPAKVSAPVTETINIAYNQCSAGAGNGPPGFGSTGSLGTCALHQEIVLPVTPGQIVLSQANGLPLDVLGGSTCSGTPGAGITLNGNEQMACGRVDPLTVTNATGLDSGWTLQGQVTDFNDPAAPSLTCDTLLTFSNHCIPGGNLAWTPDAAVGQSIVPGDTAQVAPGAAIAPFAPVAGTNTDPILSPNPLDPNGTNPAQPNSLQPNPVVESAPNAGLHNAAQTMCSTAAGQSGGTFVCGAFLQLLIPASVAEPAGGSYLATLTETLF